MLSISIKTPLISPRSIWGKRISLILGESDRTDYGPTVVGLSTINSRINLGLDGRATVYEIYHHRRIFDRRQLYNFLYHLPVFIRPLRHLVGRRIYCGRFCWPRPKQKLDVRRKRKDARLYLQILPRLWFFPDFEFGFFKVSRRRAKHRSGGCKRRDHRIEYLHEFYWYKVLGVQEITY